MGMQQPMMGGGMGMQQSMMGGGMGMQQSMMGGGMVGFGSPGMSTINPYDMYTGGIGTSSPNGLMASQQQLQSAAQNRQKVEESRSQKVKTLETLMSDFRM